MALVVSMPPLRWIPTDIRALLRSSLADPPESGAHVRCRPALDVDDDVPSSCAARSRQDGVGDYGARRQCPPLCSSTARRRCRAGRFPCSRRIGPGRQARSPSRFRTTARASADRLLSLLFSDATEVRRDWRSALTMVARRRGRTRRDPRDRQPDRSGCRAERRSALRCRPGNSARVAAAPARLHFSAGGVMSVVRMTTVTIAV